MVVILLAAASLVRFYRIADLAPFLGDQGRDLLEIKTALDGGGLPLAGPVSNQNVHAGPAYYYLIIPSLMVTGFHPIGPTIFLTFLGVISVGLIFYLGRKWFGFWTGLAVACLYAFSPPIINQTRGVWNPIPLPFFSLLILTAITKINEGHFFWLAWLGLFLGLAVQMYAPAYFLLLPVFAWLVYYLISRRPEGIFYKWLAGGLTVFVLALAPFIYFQVSTDFADLGNMITAGDGQFHLRSSIKNWGLVFSRQFESISLADNWPVNLILGLTVTVSAAAKRKYFLLFWLAGGVSLVFIYRDIHSHYLSFLWPIPFLLLGALPKKLLFSLVPIVSLLYIFNYYKSLSPTYDIYQSEEIARVAAGKIKEPTALLLLSARSPSDAHLRYLLQMEGLSLSRESESRRMILVCDQQACPTGEELTGKTLVDSYCLPKCPALPDQVYINMKTWQINEVVNLAPNQIYFLQKN